MLELTAFERLFTHSIKQVVRSKEMVYGCQLSYLMLSDFPQPSAEINPLCMNMAKFCA